VIRTVGPANPRLLVVATGNAGKLREFSALLAGLPFAIVAQGDLGVAAAHETGASFLENALLKARHAAAATGAAALADDSGLEVDALHGAPGVHSARFAGDGAGDAANNAKLLAALEGVPPDARTARYRCCLVFVDGPVDLEPLVAERTWEGAIATAPQGTAGFGYDPYFWLPERGVTAAQLSQPEKNRLSHRGRALAALRVRLAERANRRGPA
jgi:XTP/dITP diphosphohydrolase